MITKILSLIVVASGLLLVGCTSLTKVDKPDNLATQPVVNQPIVESGTTLDLSNQGLTSLPAYVLKQTNLQELNISNNNLTGALPAEIRFLSKLKVLKASNNQMTGVPAEVGQLSQLELLDLSNNQLTGLPNEIGNLTKLKQLNLSGNNYSQQDLDYILQKLPNLVVVK